MLSVHVGNGTAGVRFVQARRGRQKRTAEWRSRVKREPPLDHTEWKGWSPESCE